MFIRTMDNYNSLSTDILKKLKTNKIKVLIFLTNLTVNEGILGTDYSNYDDIDIDALFGGDSD